MRDIVSENGRFYCGNTDLPVLTTTQTSASVDMKDYDGAMVYIMADNWTDGTMTPVIQVCNDNSSWVSAATADLVLWAQTSTSDSTPAFIGNAQPTAISSAATAIYQRVGYIGNNRYLRVVSTMTGSPSTGMGYFAVINVGRPRNMPSHV